MPYTPVRDLPAARPASSGGPANPPLLVDEIFHRIALRIADGTYPPGAKIRDYALAEEYAMSRTPVREALQRLRSIGMVEVFASRHTAVSEVTDDDVAATREFVALGAGCIVRLAVSKLDDGERDHAAALAQEVAATVSRDGDWLSAQCELLRYLCDQARNPLLHLFLGDAWYLVIRDLGRETVSTERRTRRVGTLTALAHLIRVADVDGAEIAAREVFSA